MKLFRIRRSLPPGNSVHYGCCFVVLRGRLRHADRRQSRRSPVAYQSLTANVISTERASSFSARELINFNLIPGIRRQSSKGAGRSAFGFGAKRRRGSHLRLGRAFFSSRPEQRRSILLSGGSGLCLRIFLPGQARHAAPGNRPATALGGGSLQPVAHPSRQVRRRRVRHTDGRQVQAALRRAYGRIQ